MGHDATGLDALQELTREHEAVLLQVDALQQVLDDMQDGLQRADAAPLETAENVVRALRMDLDIHLRKEEAVLFPPLEAHLGREQGPIGVMLMEHEDLRRIMQRLSAAVSLLRSDAEPVSRKEAHEEMLRWGRGLVGLLRQHIAKEDQCLFPMAASRLEGGQLRALGEEMRVLGREAG